MVNEPLRSCEMSAVRHYLLHRTKALIQCFGQTNGTDIEERNIWRQGRGKERESPHGPE
jgi:hypothetical protein